MSRLALAALCFSGGVMAACVALTAAVVTRPEPAASRCVLTIPNARPPAGIWRQHDGRYDT